MSFLNVWGSVSLSPCRSLFLQFSHRLNFFPPFHLFLFSDLLTDTHNDTHTHPHAAVALRRKALINLTVWESMWEWEMRRETEREREILTEGGNTRAGEWWDYRAQWAHPPYSWVETCHDAAHPPSRRWNVSPPPASTRAVSESRPLIHTLNESVSSYSALSSTAPHMNPHTGFIWASSVSLALEIPDRDLMSFIICSLGGSPGEKSLWCSGL